MECSYNYFRWEDIDVYFKMETDDEDGSTAPFTSTFLEEVYR